MSNGYLTGCGLVISLLIAVMFLHKKNVENIETQTFKKMLVFNIFDSLTTTLIVITALTVNSNVVFKLLNRLDVIWIISWCSLMFYYIYNISNVSKKNNVKRFILIVDAIIFVLSFVLNVEIINENGILNSSGPLTYLGLVGAIFYIILMIIILIKSKNSEKLDRAKYIPLYFLIFLLIIIAILRIIIPEVNFISISFSLVDMIMVFTIENPDAKMLNEITLIKNELEKANNIKNEFIESMSHEIRTPLNAIVGFNEINNYAESLDEVRENSKEIKVACDNLLDMVKNTFDVISLGKSNETFESVSYNPKETILKVINLYKKKIEEKGIKLNSKIDDIPNLLGDKKVIGKIVNNVLNNAYKYTEKGSINILVKYIKGELIIEISDTGIGIKETELKDIFEPFKKSSDTKDSKYSGMGLGLSITKGLIDKLNGSITVKSIYKKGTTVTIKLKEEVAIK